MKASRLCFLGFCLITVFSLTSLSFSLLKGDPMKLVNTETQAVVFEVTDSKIIFYDRFLEAEMSENGITIPPILQQQYNGKEVVFSEDAEFVKAFQEIYYPSAMNSKVFQWKEQ